MSLHTSLCDLLGTELPIVQAPIGSASGPALAASVSNAGALGLISVTWREPDEVRRVVRETRALTDKPFGVNLVLYWPPEERLELCLAEGVKIVSFFWGDPLPYIERVHAAGAIVMHTVGSADEARRVAAGGVDVIVAQGWEAGGHVWGEVGGLALTPAVVDAVAPLPVVAAGGIGDGRGIAAALMLGAAGAWLGSRFIASVEAEVHPLHKGLVRDASEADTFHGTVFQDGWPDSPHRTLRNSTVERWLAAGRPAPGARPGEGEQIARYSDGTPVARYTSIMPGLGMSGELEALAIFAGQSAGLIHDILPAAEIVRRLEAEAREALRAGCRLADC